MSRYRNIFDTHAHYDDASFDGDRNALLASLPESGVCGVVNCGSDLSSSRASIAFAEQYPFFRAAVGIHPECVENLPSDAMERLEKLLSAPKVVAVGEIGLDYHFAEGAPRDEQKKWFASQIRLAKKHDLPVIVHDRDAHGDTLEILQELKPRGVVHCYSGSVETARELLKLGLYLGFGGAVTFKNAKTPVEVAAMVPEDRLVLETDCPFMAPVPFRGTRNDSAKIAYTAERIARIRGLEVQDLLDLTKKNAEALFRIS